MVGDRLPSLQTKSFSLVDKRSMGATVSKHLNYMVVGKDPDKLRMVTIWVVADLDSKRGRTAAGIVKYSSQVGIGYKKNNKINHKIYFYYETTPQNILFFLLYFTILFGIVLRLLCKYNLT